ncbi:MAG: CHASE2 domain-containing protein [Thermodesulfobacteriota bacterium]
MSLPRLPSLLALSPFKVGCLVVLAAVSLYASFGLRKPPLLETLDHRQVDAMFRFRGTIPPAQPVVIVDLDERSLAKIGQWPWPRNTVARLIEGIGSASPKAIGLDIVFAEQDRTSPGPILDAITPLLPKTIPPAAIEAIKADPRLDHDAQLGAALASTPSVLGYVFQTQNDSLKDETSRPFATAIVHIAPKESQLDQLTLPTAYRAILNVGAVSQGRSEGFFNVFPDSAGTVRRVPLFMSLDGVPCPSLALEMVRIGLEEEAITIHASHRGNDGRQTILGVSLGNLLIPTDEQGQLAVNYRGPDRTYPYVSAADILEGRGLGLLRGKYVLIGTSAAGLLDLRATPFSSIYPGVEVHANVIENILSVNPLTYDSYTEIGITASLIVVGGIALSLLLAHARPLVGGISGILMLVAMVCGNYLLLFSNQKIVGLTYPLFSLVVVFLLVTLVNYFFEGREKRFISAAFSHYVSPQVVRQLTEHPERLSLRGEQKKLTVLFSDIRGFTSISEGMTSEELGRFMNEYLSAMSRVIMARRGTVDKFIGDAVMAIWGAPLTDDDHAQNAVRAAFDMLAKLKELHGGWQARGLPALAIGVGINTGMMSVGNFGSDQRFAYTVMGDNVNLASRLEGANKIYGTSIVISEFTRAAIGDRFFCRFLDRVLVKGKALPVRIYEPVLEGVPPVELRDEEEEFLEAVDLYLDQRFAEAGQRIQSLRKRYERKLYDIYLDRIAHYQKNPPPSDWDGVFTFTSK